MKEYYSIGEVSRITGIKKDTLHFYDKIGLLKPDKIDKNNKYRYYSYKQFWIIDIIISCRSLDVPLETIKQIISTEDNNTIVNFLVQQRKTAEAKRDYFQRIMDDIDWYCDENKKIKSNKISNKVYLEEFEEEKVIYGTNKEFESAYHLKLQEAYLKERKEKSIQRNYGYVINIEDARQNVFHKTGEYIRFNNIDLEHISDESVLVIPKGRYLCTDVIVRNEYVDLKKLFDYAEKHDYKIKRIFADEIGLQLFYYDTYPCKIRAEIENHT